MSEKTRNSLNWEAIKSRGLATSIEELPSLREGFARGVHITSSGFVESILEQGLDYSRQGMLMSTAQIWSDDDEVAYKSDDPRFGKGNIDIVFDLSFAETKLHNRAETAPGIITPDHIVGVIDPYQE